MRVEANVSLRPRGTEAFGTRVEVKNMNSFRAVERAIAFEIERQARGPRRRRAAARWRPAAGTTAARRTYRMRAKETSEDYRYFPEPDLPPLHVEPAWIDRVRAALPELPAARRARYEALGHHRLRRGGARGRPGMTGAFEAISAAAGPSVPAKEVVQLRLGHPRAGREGRRAQRGRHRRRLHARRDRGAAGRHRGRYRLAPGRPRPPGAAPRGRHARPTSCSRAPGPGPSRTTPRCWRMSTP